MAKSNLSDSGGQRMRVLRIAHSSLTPALRQRERAVVRCYPDVDLEVITTPRWREAEMEVDVMPDDMFPVRTAGSYFSKHIQLFAYDPRPIINALRRHRPHLVDLSHEPYSIACAEVLTLCKWFAPKVPIVMQTNQNILHNYPPPFNWLEQRAFRRIAAAYACSETVVEVLRAKGFHKPAPIIPFGVNTEAFRPKPAGQWRSNGTLTIGFVGRMLPGKGLNVLADALEKLKGDAWQILVVGDGPEREGFEQRLRAAGLRDRAEFGRVIVEAMASGVPVVGSTCGAIPEVIGEAGLVFPEGDAGALADALRRMLSDEDLRQRLSIGGQARVERYSWERVAEKTYDLYQQAIGARTKTIRNSRVELAA